MMNVMEKNNHITLPLGKMIILVSHETLLYSHPQNNILEDNCEEKIIGKLTTNKSTRIANADTFPKMRSLVKV